MLSFKTTFSLSSFTFIKRLFISSLLSAIKVVSSPYLRLLVFLSVILIPTCALSSLAFHIMYSSYKLNKQGDSIQPWSMLFTIWSQFLLPCPLLTLRLDLHTDFSGGQVVWYFHILKNFPHFVVIHTIKGFSIISKAEVDFFLELSCFFNDPMDVGNLISGSSAF